MSCLFLLFSLLSLTPHSSSLPPAPQTALSSAPARAPLTLTNTEGGCPSFRAQPRIICSGEGFLNLLLKPWAVWVKHPPVGSSSTLIPEILHHHPGLQLSRSVSLCLSSLSLSTPWGQRQERVFVLRRPTEIPSFGKHFINVY